MNNKVEIHSFAELCAFYHTSTCINVHHPIPAGNHSIAVVKGHESYETISKAFSATFREIDTLLDHGFIEVGENRYLFFGGDMKVHA